MGFCEIAICGIGFFEITLREIKIRPKISNFINLELIYNLRGALIFIPSLPLSQPGVRILISSRFFRTTFCRNFQIDRIEESYFANGYFEESYFANSYFVKSYFVYIYLFRY